MLAGRAVTQVLRSLARRPGYTAAALATLALGIGAATSIFAVVEAVLLRPLPYPDVDHLVTIRFLDGQGGPVAVSPGELATWRGHARCLSAVAAIAFQLFELPRREAVGAGSRPATGAVADAFGAADHPAAAPERVRGALVSAALFRLLGARAEIGRLPGPDEDRPDATPVVVLSHSLWTERYRGDPAVLGQTLRVEGDPGHDRYTVIGVLPRGFTAPAALHLAGPDLWLPLGSSSVAADRTARSLFVAGRLSPGVGVERSASELQALARSVRVREGTVDPRARTVVETLREATVRPARPTLLLLSVAVGALLLIAAANAASLLLAGALVREQEIAVRAALGAGRLRVAGSFLVEALVLTLGGGLVGIVGAAGALPALLARIPVELPRVEEVRLGGTVLLFSLGLSLLVGSLCALAPTLRLLRSDVGRVLQEGAPVLAGRKSRLRPGLVVAEVALALALTVSGVVLSENLVRLQRIDLGFDPTDVTTMAITLSPFRYPTPDSARPFVEELLERVEAIPGVVSAAVAADLPLLAGGLEGYDMTGRAGFSPGESWVLGRRRVTPGYFSTLRIPILAGHGLGASEGTGEAPEVLVNRTFARRLWGSVGNLPAEFELGRGRYRPVAVVGDVRQGGARSEVTPELFVPFAVEPRGRFSLIVRSPRGGPPLAPALRAAVWAVDPNQPAGAVRTMDELRSEETAEERFLTLLLGLFSAAALLLAAVGVYGTVATSVAERTREIGVRMALGAERRTILRLVLRQGTVLAAAGLVLGLPLAWATGRLLEGLLFRVSPHDPAVLVGVSVLLTVVSLVASLLPAHRAASVDPAASLRRG